MAAGNWYWERLILLQFAKASADCLDVDVAGNYLAIKKFNFTLPPKEADLR